MELPQIIKAKCPQANILRDMLLLLVLLDNLVSQGNQLITLQILKTQFRLLN
jgi:hypothetical protein